MDNKKEIVFVIGPPNGGKSYFINKFLKDFHKIDLFDYQHNIRNTVGSVEKSYEACAEDLRKACHRYNKIVLEHTLMLSKRRPFWINLIKEELGEDTKIKCFYVLPELEKYIEYDKKNLNEWNNKHPNNHYLPTNVTTLREWSNLFEIPSTDEGFSSIQKV